MKEFVRRLSRRAELLLVLLIAFGTTVPASLRALMSPETLAHRVSPPISNAALHGTIVYEIVIFAVLAAFLRARGWTLERLGLKPPTVADCAIGIVIAIVHYIAYVLLVNVVANVWPDVVRVAMSTRLVASDLTWPTVGAVILINPVFEEVFVCGYVISVLKESRGATTAINVSAGIRVFYHLYQGALGILSITPMALIFAYWFARTGRLWPLIVAHALEDFVGLVFGRG